MNRLRKIALVIALVLGFQSVSGLAQEDDATALSRAKEALGREDYALAAQDLQPLVERGNDLAALLLGHMYLDGKGVSKDIERGTQLVSKSTDGGNASIQLFVGEFYLNGLKVPRNERKAYPYLLASAEQGLPEAQFTLGVLLDPGLFEMGTKEISYVGRPNVPTEESLPKSGPLSFMWYKRAADQGLAEAQFNVAIAFKDGKGTPVHKLQAFRYFRLAALQGHDRAQNNLGAMYVKGDPIPRDLLKAYVLFSLAAATDLNMAERNRNEIAKELDISQQNRGDELAAQCLATKYANCKI